MEQPGFCCGTPCAGEEERVERLHVRLQADQPVVAVPVYQEIHKRDKYIEVPQIEVTDNVVPRVYNRSAVHDVPKCDVTYGEQDISIETEKIVERDVEVPVKMGYAPQFVKKWDIREVPRPVPKYEGEQQVIEIDVPTIEYKDRHVEKEVVVDVKETIIPRVTEVVKEVEVMQYDWKQKFQDVPVYKFVPKFDVELDCPPALIVPYPETRYVIDEPKVTNPYCTFGVCCGSGGQPIVKTVEKVIQQEQQRLYPGSASLTAGGLSGQPGSLPYPVQGDFASSFAHMTQETVLKGPLMGDAPVKQATLSQLTPGPVMPRPTPQVAADGSAKLPGARLEKKKQSFWSWLTGKKEEEVEEKPTLAGVYPENMPTDFADHFNQQAIQERVQENEPEKEMEESSELEPSVVYRGAISKPPEYGGELDPISFKLHAIEVHQFVPLPNQEIPEFVRKIGGFGDSPKEVSPAPGGEADGGLDKLLLSVPSGWADPDVTGVRAYMMSEILSTTMQNVQIGSPVAPLVNQLSSQFAKQGVVPGGTQEGVVMRAQSQKN